MPILPYGGILPLSDVSPSRGLCVYHRVSTSAQAGPKKEGYPKLRAAAWDVYEKVNATAPGRIVGEPFYEQAHGQLWVPKPRLVEASLFSKENDLTLVFFELSRGLRAKDYHRHKNFGAVPSYQELIELRKLTNWARLATYVPPGTPENAKRSEAIRRPGTAGRKSKWKLLGAKAFRMLGPRRDQQALVEVAAQLGIGASTLGKWLAATVPPKYINGEQGVTWGRLHSPEAVFRIMLADPDQRA